MNDEASTCICQTVHPTIPSTRTLMASENFVRKKENVGDLIEMFLKRLSEQDVFVKHKCPRSCHSFENCDLDI